MFIVKYNKEYTTVGEYERRFSTFASNLMEIQRHNSKEVRWTKAVNQFADMTTREFKHIHGGYTNMYRPTASSTTPKLYSSFKFPEHKDWRDAGVITSVKNQGACGSCWAHAGTEQLESYLKLQTNVSLKQLSVQQVTSCTPNPLQCGRRGGCSGGIAQFVFEYARLIGVMSEEEYPYISDMLGSWECLYNGTNETPLVYVRGHETLQHNNYHAVMNHIANVGPLAVSVWASGWKDYDQGIYDGCSYDQNIELDHAVQLVGYGTDDQLGDYWLVRNSWGTSWGENGYIRLKRENTIMCGKNKTPLTGSGCKDDGIKVQTVCGMCGVLFEATYPIGTELTRHEEPDVLISQV